jgi:integrase
MPKSHRPSLGSHLEWHGNKIRVVVRVPPSLVKAVGVGKLRETLPTANPRDAEALKWAVISRLKKHLNEVRTGRKGDELIKEAFSWRESIQAEEEKVAEGKIEPWDTVIDSVMIDRAEEIEKEQGPVRSALFAAIAQGRATPLTYLVDDWFKEKNYAGRTEAAFRHGIRLFEQWCQQAKVPPSIENVNKKVVGRFVSERFISQGVTPATANKAITGLRSYWTWLHQRGHLEEDKNPWAGQSLKDRTMERRKAQREPWETDKRPFTDDEVKTLIDGISKQPLSDFCLIAALTGMRRDEIANLQVRHITEDTIKVPGTKSASAIREIPAHPALKEILAKRCDKKGNSTYLFQELPTQKTDARGRGAPITQAFTRTRRDLGVDDTPEGSRQSRVDLHSFRRWFIRKAVQALKEGATGFTAWTIADVVGHSKEDGPLPMTMGRYPGRADLKALRACVEAVRVPE